MLINENWSPPPPAPWYRFRIHLNKIVSLCCVSVLMNYLLVLPISQRAVHTENLDTQSPQSLSKQVKVVWNSSLNQHFLYGTTYCNTDKTKLLNNKTKTCEQNVLCKPSALVSRTKHPFCVTRRLTPKWHRSWPLGTVWLWSNKSNVHECHMTVHAQPLIHVTPNSPSSPLLLATQLLVQNRWLSAMKYTVREKLCITIFNNTLVENCNWFSEKNSRNMKAVRGNNSADHDVSQI